MSQPEDITAAGRSDIDLLTEFLVRRDEPAFAAIVRRHGGMVSSVCRSVLGNTQDAEDAAQAVFLTLARRAASLRGRTTLVGWLHRVAWYVAARAAEARAIRRRHEQEAARMKRDTDLPEAAAIPPDVLHAALAELPEKYRAPLLLHHLEGRSEAETASLLGCGLSAASVRLTRGRKMLRARLARRGLAATAAGVVTAIASQAPAEVTSTLATTASRAALAALSGNATATSALVGALSEGAMNMLFWSKVKTVVMVALVALLAGGVGVGTYSVLAGNSAVPEISLATQPTTTAETEALNVKNLITLRVQDDRLVGAWVAAKTPTQLAAFRTADPPLLWSARVHDGEDNRPGNFWIQGSDEELKTGAGVWLCTARATGDVLWLRAYYGKKNPTCAIELVVEKDKIRFIRTAWSETGTVVRDVDVTVKDLKELKAEEPEKVRKYLAPLLSLFTSADLLADPARDASKTRPTK